jgi:putative two-component system response regulator
MENQRNKIILVDDNITTLTLGSFTLTEKYDIFTVPSGAKLFKLLEKVIPNLILLDIDMPEMDGYEVMKRLKANPHTAGIPVIFLTGKNDIGSELEGLSLGAVDYISKPLSPPLLLKRIELHLLMASQTKTLMTFNNNLQSLVQEQAKKLMEMQTSILKTMADLVEYRDKISGDYVDRTRMYLELLLDAMTEQRLYLDEIAAWDREFLLKSSQLHNLGNIAIRESILLKPGKLTEEEFNEVKNHTLFGVRIIDEIEKHTTENSFLEHAKIFAATHHEKWDGTGYPYGLERDGIPLQGRVMAIADVYNVLVSPRPYKAPLTHEEAVKIILDGKGTFFDPALTDLFGSVSGQFSQVGGLREIG